MLANGTKPTLEFRIGRKIWAAGFCGSGRSRLALDLLEQITHRLLPMRGRSTEVNLGPASEVLLENGIGQRIQLRGRCFWRFVSEIWHS